MPTELLLNRTGDETRTAVLEDGHLVGLLVERRRDLGVVGNIYLGRVVRVLPGMQAAFVDIGLERAAFLYVGDIARKPPPAPTQPEATGEESPLEQARDDRGPQVPDDFPVVEQGAESNSTEDGSPGEEEPAPAPAERPRRSLPPIQDLIRSGDILVVQVTKDPIGTKGARLTCHVTLPGRFLVLLTDSETVGVSRRISESAERERLRAFVSENRQPGEGFIVRTVCEGLDTHNLSADMDYLRRTWAAISETARNQRAPALLHRDLDLPLRTARDLLTDDVTRFLVDDEGDYNRILSFMSSFMPRLRHRLDWYRSAEPIFDAYGVEQEIDRALSRKVWLRSGGYLVIDHTEALTAVDVNTGRYVGARSLEDTTLKVNLEAAEEIVRQIRVRDIGGIIIIDFIDMEQQENREAVYNALCSALEGDHARTNVLPISEFGLVEMTRKRVREDLVKYLSSACEHCAGRGFNRSSETMAYELARELRRQRARSPRTALHVTGSPDVIELFETGFARLLTHLREDAAVELRATRAHGGFEVHLAG